MFGKLICGAALAACLAVPAMAENSSMPVVFAAGTTGTAVTGQISGTDIADFTLVAEAGQRFSLRMVTDNPAARFDIYAPASTPGSTPPLYSSAVSGMTADISLPASGTYLIRTYLTPGDAAQPASARFSLTIDVGGTGQPGQDVADGLSGGPDYWQVTGITDRLNIRAEPSTAAAVAGMVTNGTVLKNGGCKPAEGRTWCKVETTSGTAISGWTVNEFLQEGAAPDMAQTEAATPAAEAPATTEAPPPAAPAASTDTAPPPAAPTTSSARPPVPTRAKIMPPADTPPAPQPTAVPAPKPAPKPAAVADTAPAAAPAATPSVSASGSLPCSTSLGMPTRECAFAVSRQGEGSASITVGLPGGGSRELRFEKGAPAPVDGQRTERRGDLTVIEIGEERYEIPDAVIFGG